MRLTLLLASLLAVLALASCGDDDEGSGAGSGSGGKSKAAYLAEVDEICAESKRKLDEFQQESDPGDFAGLLERTQDHLRQAVERARAVEKPDDATFASDVDAYFDAVEEQVDGFDPLIEAARAGDQAALEREAAAVERSGEEVQRTARDLGFEECASDATTETDTEAGATATAAESPPAQPEGAISEAEAETSARNSASELVQMQGFEVPAKTWTVSCSGGPETWSCDVSRQGCSGTLEVRRVTIGGQIRGIGDVACVD